MRQQLSIANFQIQPGDRVLRNRAGWESNPDHNLFLNHHTWWGYLSIVRPGQTAVRLTFSLKTKVLAVARERRDRVLAAAIAAYGVHEGNLSWVCRPKGPSKKAPQKPQQGRGPAKSVDDAENPSSESCRAMPEK